MDKLFLFISHHPFLIATFALLLALLLRLQSSRSGKNVSPQELVNLVNRELAIVLDVRDAKDFGEGHIVDAVNIPHTAIESRLSELNKYQNRAVIVVCKMGQNAGMVGTSLHKAGFEQVSRLSGGMAEWRNQNLPVVKGRSKTRDKSKAKSSSKSKNRSKDKPNDKPNEKRNKHEQGVKP